MMIIMMMVYDYDNRCSPHKSHLINTIVPAFVTGGNDYIIKIYDLKEGLG